MSYDYAGPTWSTHTSHASNLYPSPTNPASTPFNTLTAVTHYLSPHHHHHGGGGGGGGIPPRKLVLGMPLYGRAFGHTDGAGCSFRGHGGDNNDGGVSGSWEAGVWDYKALPRPEAVEGVDEGAGASWCFDEGRRVWVSYDDVGVARVKSAFIGELGLGGGMWWESSGDREVGGEGGGSLIATVGSLFRFCFFRCGFWGWGWGFGSLPGSRVWA